MQLKDGILFQPTVAQCLQTLVVCASVCVRTAFVFASFELIHEAFDVMQ